MMTDIRPVLERMVRDCPACYGHGVIIICPGYFNAEQYKRRSALMERIIKGANYQGKVGESRWNFAYVREGIYCLNGKSVYEEPGLQECFYCGELRDYLGIESEELTEEFKEIQDEIITYCKDISHAA